MIYKERPQNFNSKFDVVGCFLEHDREILLLHRQDHKPEGNTWGVPAGKVDEGENIMETIIREMREETGLILNSSQLSHFGTVFVKYLEYDFVYHIFDTQIFDRRNVVINHAEHKDFKWVSPKEALSMPMIQDLDNCVKLFYNI